MNYFIFAIQVYAFVYFSVKASIAISEEKLGLFWTYIFFVAASAFGAHCSFHKIF